ncbi:MAG: phosphoribosyl-ATP diphosphatase [Rhodospirillales bacterium]|nr:MAG: phosphoribosyl-ATP diphosphatase [Rhodospirillales bacterium]
MPDAADGTVLDRLFAVIERRRGADAGSSYTARLLAEGRPTIARKVGEEAVEVVVASLAAEAGHPDRLAEESADLLYHLLVLWADAGIPPEAVWRVLAEREGTSGLAEKAARSQR